MSLQRTWSWAASDAVVAARRADARALIGEVVHSIRYFTLDYHRHEVRPDLVDQGPRRIEGADELAQPTWRFEGVDAMDFGLEMEAQSGVVASITWDPPGDHEGIGIQTVPMLGTGVAENADVAIWDVGDVSPAWQAVRGIPLTRVELHYLPWDESAGSHWCPRITLHAHDGAVEIVLGDVQENRLVPSADDVAVLHPSTSLPTWHQG